MVSSINVLIITIYKVGHPSSIMEKIMTDFFLGFCLWTFDSYAKNKNIWWLKKTKTAIQYYVSQNKSLLDLIGVTIWAYKLEKNIK